MQREIAAPSEQTRSVAAGTRIGIGGKQLLPKIHVHRSGEAGIFANAYIVEGQSGLVVIDGTLTVSESGRLRKTAESLGKPIMGILITHAHPDHVAGISRLAHSDAVPIYALGSVANHGNGRRLRCEFRVDSGK
jgi:glyoxylase-like metal-dependent hydrolase (beta-lactamase superfamily II)